MTITRKAIVGTLIGAASALSFSMPAFAHDCFNPTKVPTAGVNYEITGIDSNGNATLVQVGPGQGIGGFAAIAPGTFGPNQTQTLYTHTLGSGHNPFGVVGGPGSQTPAHACNGTGIDYIDVCLGAG